VKDEHNRPYNDRTMGKAFYVTTPIYYVNDVPHIGHAYTTVATDFVARYHRLRGEDVFFLTGTDEHSQNVARRAAENGVTPQEWTDSMDPQWREVWERLDISNDDFIRTTEPRHARGVQAFMQAVHDNGYIRLGHYEGPYCFSCEAYYTEDELVDGNCPIHLRPVEFFREDNYFFELSKFQDRLLQLYEENRTFVQPEARRNEVLAFVKGGLQDFSISRTSFKWGIPLPWNPDHVTYVWGDALANYITAVGYGADDERFRSHWPADVHLMAKDILRFHAVYWPALLMAAGIDPPRQVFVHGYLLVGGEKMSKTRLTGIHPFELVDHFGVDAYRYYFLREISFGQDGSFSWESMVDRYNADLANGLGNLASRVLAMLGSNFDGLVPDANDPAHAGRLPELAADVAARYDMAMDELALTTGVAAVWELVAEANRYLVDKAPWAMAKDPSRRDELAAVLYASAEVLRVLAVLISPLMPNAAGRLWSQLGIPEPLEGQRLSRGAMWGGLDPGTRTARGDALFPRLDE
jgi:methionyl-tRNA synthetase